jgi:transposase
MRVTLKTAHRVWTLLILGKGIGLEECATLESISVQTIYNWLKAFLLHGVASLGYRVSPGRKPKLTKSQKRELVKLIKAGPLAAGYGTACWYSLLVQDLIYRRYGVLYNRHYVCQLLHNLGFSFQKARFVSSHLDSERRKTWLESTWPEVLRLSEEKNTVILFEDEVSFSQWGSLGYTWAPIGQQPEVKTTGIRKGYKVFGAIEYFTGRFYYWGMESKFNSEKYQQFLRYLMKKIQKPILIIHDNAKYHISKQMRVSYEAYKGRLQIFELPSYSPDYNPIEFLWKKMKVRATHNKYFPDFEDLVSSVETALTYFSSHRKEISSLMGVYIQTLEDTQAAA